MTLIDTDEARRAHRRFVKTAMTRALLSPEEEHELARRWRTSNDTAALHALTTAYMRLVVAMATRFKRSGLPVGDLVQEGAIGLMQAAARFEPERGVRFSTYASWWIRSTIQDYVLRNWSIVRTGTTATQKALFFNLRRLQAKIASATGETDAAAARAAIGMRLGVTVGEVAAMEHRLAAPDRSLNAPAAAEGETEYQDLLQDDRPDPEAMVMETHDAAIRANWIARALRRLSPRERAIIRARRLADETTTLETLGERLGISKERVRQIESTALSKLREALISDVRPDELRELAAT
ncbi:MAG: RNA polymerase factor sigma-32 [Alphaproteobacteria bacterium]|nr:RNA polymerase factor sigma-32 [Alphaproteobacteria bacterium]